MDGFAARIQALFAISNGFALLIRRLKWSNSCGGCLPTDGVYNPYVRILGLGWRVPQPTVGVR